VSDFLKASLILTFITCALADVENADGKFDLAVRSNKWEGEDEEEEVKVKWFFFARTLRKFLATFSRIPRAIPNLQETHVPYRIFCHINHPPVS